MKHNERLTDIIKKKDFKSFWVCYHYLLDAGYSSMDSFAYTLKEFGEDKIFTDVAFIRLDTGDIYRSFAYGEKFENTLIIGLINESNIHLSGLYNIYLNKLSKNNKTNIEIESTCEIITIKKMNPLIIDYLLDVSSNFFKIDLKGYIKNAHDNERKKIKEDLTGSFNHPHASDYITSIDPATADSYVITRRIDRRTGESFNDYGNR